MQEIKKSSVIRRAQRGSGITGLTIELQLVHLQNIAIIRDEAAKWIEQTAKVDDTSDLIGKMAEILNFIVQQDFQSPVSKDLWIIDPEEKLSTPYPSKF